MSLLDPARATDRTEDLRTRIAAFTLALLSVFVATSLACYAFGMRGAPGRPGMFLVVGIFELARALGPIPSLVATLLLLGSATIAIFAGSSPRSLAMRCIEATTAGFLLAVLMGSLGNDGGGELGIVLGARLAAFMSTPIAATLCAVTAVLAVSLAIEGNLREAARLRVAESGGARSLAPAGRSPESTPLAAAVLAPAEPEVERAAPAAAATEFAAVPPPQEVSGLSAYSGGGAAVLDAPPADPEVRLRPRRSYRRDLPPIEPPEPPRRDEEESPRSEALPTSEAETPAELLPPSSEALPAELVPDGAEGSVRDRIDVIHPDPVAEERLHESNETALAEELAGESILPAEGDGHARLADGGAADGGSELARGASGDVGLESESGDFGGDVAGVVQPAGGVDAPEVVGGAQSGEERETPTFEGTERVEVDAVAPATDSEPSGGEREAVEERVEAREPQVIVVRVPDATYADEWNWSLPRTIPGAEEVPVAASPIQPPTVEVAPTAEIASAAADENEAPLPYDSPLRQLVKDYELKQLVTEYDTARALVPSEPDLAEAGPLFVLLRERSEAMVEEPPAAEASLLDRAARCVLGEGRASISFLQRKLQVSFNDAQHLMAQLEQAGVVGPYRGNPARDILLTLSDWEARRASASE